MGMRVLRILIILEIGLLWACTPIMMDHFVRVKGSIVSSEDMSYYYFLDIYIEESDELYHTNELNSESFSSFEFVETVSLSIPKAQKYYFVVRSPDSKLQHRTASYELGHKDYYKNPIDLGVIELK